jgi:hypothetical protein
VQRFRLGFASSRSGFKVLRVTWQIGLLRGLLFAGKAGLNNERVRVFDN